MVSTDEKMLIDRARTGDAQAFGSLMENYLPRIYNLCLGLTRNVQDAEDLAQESFLKAYRAIHLYQGKSSFYTWLYRIAVNVCLDFQRASSRRTTVSLDQTFGEDEQPIQVRDEAPLPDDQAISHELGRELMTRIGQLPEAMRDVLLLRDVEGLTYDEIARLLNLSEGTVKSRLFRARSQVMRAMTVLQPSEQISLRVRPTEQRRAAR